MATRWGTISLETLSSFDILYCNEFRELDKEDTFFKVGSLCHLSFKKVIFNDIYFL